MKHFITNIYLKGFLFGILVIIFPKLIETVAGTDELFALLFYFGGYIGFIVIYVIASLIILYLLSTIPLKDFISNQKQFLFRTNIVRFNLS